MGYEEGQEWVLSKMETGYPRWMLKTRSSMPSGIDLTRFFVHKSIQAFAGAILARHGSPSEEAFLFPSYAVASRCVGFLQNQIPCVKKDGLLRIVNLLPNAGITDDESLDNTSLEPVVCAVIFPKIYKDIAKAFWQHSGDGISGRRAEYCHRAFDDGRLGERKIDVRIMSPNDNTPALLKGPRRYQKNQSKELAVLSQQEVLQVADAHEGKDCVQFVEERFGRNLDVSFAENAKLAIRRRIAGALTANVDLHEALQVSDPPSRRHKVANFSENDVYLHPCGMSAIFNTHRIMMTCRGNLRSVCYG